MRAILGAKQAAVGRLIRNLAGSRRSGNPLLKRRSGLFSGPPQRSRYGWNGMRGGAVSHISCTSSGVRP